MMNKTPFLVIIYQLFFVTLSMALVTALEGYGTEMFAGAFYFNLIYLVVGGIVDYLFYVILQHFYFDKVNKLLVTHFLACLLLMNLLCFYFDNSWISWTAIKGFFIDEDDSFWVALVVHALMIVCYWLSVFITRRLMRKDTSIENTKATQ
jgi:hypothetical protein